MEVGVDLPCRADDGIGFKVTAVCKCQSVLLKLEYSAVVLYLDVPVNN